MCPSTNKFNKRSIDCISGRNGSNNGESSCSSSSIGEHKSNETWNNNENTKKNKIQKLNSLTALNLNLNVNHVLSSSQSQLQSPTRTPTLWGVNRNRNIARQTSSSSSIISLPSSTSNTSLKSLLSSSSENTNTNPMNTKDVTTVVAHNGHCLATFPRHSSERPAPSMVIPVLSPCTYLTISLQNKKIKPRIDSFSIEQALFFEPYQESTIKMELLQALRSSNLDQLKSYQEVKSSKKKKNQEQRQQQQDEKDETSKNEAGGDDDGVITDDDCDNDSREKNTTIVDLKACNQFGENLLHLACRIGICQSILEFLLEEAQVALNVRDRFGRTPLHNACMSAHPNFNNIDYLISTQPRMVLFEDDKGKIPFDLIPHRCYEQWQRFLSEKNILQRVVSAELEWKTTER